MVEGKRPYRQRTNAPSNSALFEKRGDPWVSQRQGQEDFGRSLRIENPDLDMYTSAGRAKERHELGPDKPIGKKAEVTDQRRAANANLRFKARLKRTVITVKDGRKR